MSGGSSSSVPSSLGSSFFGLPTFIEFEGDHGTSPGATHYSFYIRDTMHSSLLVKGNIDKRTGSGSMYNVNGVHFLDLDAKGMISPAPEMNRDFEIRHRGSKLGSIAIRGPTSVKLLNTLNKMNYVINSMRPGDISISKSATEQPICNIHMEESGSGISFSGTVLLSFETSKYEQCLFISLAVAYMVSQNKAFEESSAKTARNEAEEEASEWFWAIIGAIIVIILLAIGGYYLFTYLNRRQCLKRKANWPEGYKDREC